MTRLLKRAEVTGRIGALQAAYEAMYDMSPGDGEAYSLEVLEHSRRDGFRLAASLDLGTGAALGFGFGFTGAPGQTWRDSLVAAVEPPIAAEWLTGHFEFAQFGVIPAARRRGVATQIYRALFHGLPHERAILTVIESNTPARAFYDARGWEVLHRGFFSSSGLGPYLIMGNRLPRGS